MTKRLAESLRVLLESELYCLLNDMERPLPMSIHDNAEYSHSSSISEVDSLSDSEWLDVSSSKESDDNDSVSSRDFDTGIRGLLSRRSSTSNWSSRGGDVEAWEGLADDSADEGFDDHVASIVPLAFPHATEVELTPVARKDSVDEQRVLDELDQSMTSPLSSSRESSLVGTHSSTVHSTRDLRLSFPDPLTSSRDELHRCFDDFSPSETNFSITDVEDTAALPVPSPGVDLDPPLPSPSLDFPRVPTPPGIVSADPDFDVILYGRSTDIKWSFVFELLQLAERLPTLKRLSLKTVKHNAHLQHYVPTDRERSPFSNGVNVIDRTDSTIQDVTRSSLTPDSMLIPPPQPSFKLGERPSLGIVYLPCTPSVSQKHTLYLPVFPSRMHGTDCSYAIHSWRALRIPGNKVLPLRRDSFLYIVANELDETDDLDAYNAFNALRDEHKRVPCTTGERVAIAASQMTLYVFSVVASLFHMLISSISLVGLAFLALCIITVIVRTCYPASAVSSTSKDRSSWGIWNPDPNCSAVIQPQTAVSVTPSSMKGFFNAASPLSTNRKPYQAVVGSSSNSKPACDQCKVMTWSERFQSSKDIILRDVHSFDIQAHSKAARSTARSAQSKALSLIAPAHKKAEALSSNLCVKLADSLSEIVDMNALAVVFRDDLKELADAIDALIQVISRQSSAIVSRSKRSAQILRERLQHGHRRAQRRARKLKAFGEQLLAVAEEDIKARTYIVRESLKGRAKIAREKARTLKGHWLWAHQRFGDAKWVKPMPDGKRKCKKNKRGCLHILLK
jgi:hypothetical protein